MDRQLEEGDRLFLIAEDLAKDFSLFPEAAATVPVRGLMSDTDIKRSVRKLAGLDIDSYIESVVSPANNKARRSAPEDVRTLGRVVEERSDGPFFQAKVEMDFNGERRVVGFIAQDRSTNNGVWMPEHHLAAARFVEDCSRRALPIVSLMDTPGADPNEEANRNNQAHSISQLISEMSNVDVPNLGIIYGLGYSGGAIPLAASNMILSVRDGVFSTIQPPGLASIARRLGLSWQECAKYVGLSPFELYDQGNIDAIIDYAPGENDKLENFRQAIVSGIESVEQKTREFVGGNPYIMEHYRLSVRRYLQPSETLRSVSASSSLRLSQSPTEYVNVFGVAYRYLRYLKVRQRIKATSASAYGRLAVQEMPAGELDSRSELERRRAYLKWLQDPDKVIYDDTLSKAWRNYSEKRDAIHDDRGRLGRLIFGEPQKNYEAARSELITTVGLYLYNRWKAEAVGNIRALRNTLQNPQDFNELYRAEDFTDAPAIAAVLGSDDELDAITRQRFSHEGRKLLRNQVADRADSALSALLANELNLLLTGGSIAEHVPSLQAEASALKASGASELRTNRQLIDSRIRNFLQRRPEEAAAPALSDLTVLDVLLNDDLREEFVAECENLLLFDSVYDQIIANLDTIAEEAEKTQALAKESVAGLMNTTLDLAARGITLDSASSVDPEALREQFFTWYREVAASPDGNVFFRSVEEWKKGSFPYLSDTLFVVVTFLFENLFVSYLQSEKEGSKRKYDPRIAPRNIGRKKDFWNRLEIAYRDLLIQNLLRSYKNTKKTGYQAFIDTFFTDFTATREDLLSSDPVRFPGFRQSIEKALQKNVPPCGIVTGIGTFKDGSGGIRCGAVISNLDFQAGAFDMASAEKFIKLLVDCAEQHLPVVCFVSSGGMQTKEGAGALFSMAAVNDRVTRFVRDHDLPVIMFGYGDCTGGSQASFVTHPLVHTYYLSGTDMPFAGQIVVPSNLPSSSTLANYLSLVPDSMAGLVKHPFYTDMDDELRKIDPEIPVPQETVGEVVRRVMAGVFSQTQPVVVAHRPRFTDADLIRPVRRVLIHARGCTAAKLIRIAQRCGIEVVLVQSDPDMDSACVDMLGDHDTLVCIGGNTPDESYLNAQSVLRVAEREGVDALHPGIGFLSENSGFASLVRNHGINFIGPMVTSMETMGNKSNAINTSLRLGVPVVPGSHGILTDVNAAGEVAAEIGYPVLIKAVHGGGGKGIQVVENGAEFDELFQRVTMEARSAFGNGDVYLEKYVTSLRHIEVQVLRDTHGNTKVLGIRDCSVQRDKQKVIEESGSTALPPHLEEQVLKHTAAIADEVDYRGAGTVEFIYDLKNEAVYFMEMNTRLQVEHPVTEYTSGVDIVAEQFRIAGGESIADLEVADDGFSIEARINAESISKSANGSLQFRPDPGVINECEFPEEEGVDVITMAATGKEVSPFYDSLIAQVVVHAEDRNAAAAKLCRYLERVKIRGIRTNIALLKRILVDSVFLEGVYDTDYLPQLLARSDIDQIIAEIDEVAGSISAGIDRDSVAIEDSDELKVLSPSTGIFYITPSPNDPEYVSVGQRISIDDTVCQLEAMKIFSPLRLRDFNTAESELYPADQRFEVTRVNVANAQQVTNGDLLFVVRPVDA